MSEEKSFEELEEVKTELELLRARAKQMGINHHPSIGLAKLKNKINAQLAEPVKEVVVEEEIVQPAASETPSIPKVIVKTEAQKKNEKMMRLRKDASKLIRIRVANMNPNKKEWEGEMYTVSNSVVGTFKKFVPFNNDEGWHVPNIIYKHMKEKECQIFHTVRGPRGNKVRKGKIIKELSIEVLPALSDKEMTDLATKQAMANTID